MAQVQVSPNANGDSAAAAAFVPNQSVMTSLYVGDLDRNVKDPQLYDLFNQIGQVVSARVCRDLATQQSLGYGYVNFSNPQDAARALDVLNFTPLNNKPIRIMYSHRDPSSRTSGAANIFIKNLDKSIDHKALHDTFSSFGTILSCKIATDPSGQSKGFGFVQFEKEESAQNAIDKLNGMLINDKQVYVGHFQRKQDRESVLSANTKFSNVYVKNLSESMSDDNLKKIFGEYGTITSAVVMRDLDGKSKCFGFVNFENADDAAKAVEALNGKKFDDKEWYVGKAQKKSERELALKERFEQSMKEAADKYQGANLYLKNLDDSIDDVKLRELFSDFGTITSCKVMRDPHGVSRGSGFVAFSSPEEATRALGEMKGKLISGKPLYVALAQRKEERRAKLQAQFSQMTHVSMAPSVAPHLPLYPPRAMGLGHPFLYGQAPPAVLPQAGFGYQQQLVPGMRPGAPMPSFFVPVVQQGQQGQHPGVRRGTGPVQQPQQPVPMMQQQMLPRGRGHRYPGGRNMQEVPMLAVNYDMGALPIRDAMGQPMPIQALATALANAPPGQQRTMLGEALYPLVDKLEHDAAAKVTGMLLEMDQPEVLHLIESPDALKAKVAEAMDVLKNVAQQQTKEKRCLDSASADEGQPDRKRPALASVIVEALKVDSLQKLCSSLEPILRRVVSEEVERALAKLGPAKLTGRSSPKRIEGRDGKNLQLHFKTRLSLPLFTGGKVEGEQGSAAIHIVLIDANTGQIVTSGPESCAKLDVIVLEGDFNNEDDDNWTEEDFESHVVKEREGKRPLLAGDLQVTLKDGIGTLGELSFTDNSSWIRSRKFRLGLKVASGCCERMRIREAKTEAFTVKDHRGELYKKHYPPALTDEVWRLEKIGKDGSFHKRLNKAGIYTVEDFLRLVVRDPQRLRNILGSGMSNKMWDILVEHAKTCVLSGNLYVYYPDEARNVGVVFNNIYELSGLIANDQYYPADSLSESQKVYVDTLVKKAYENWMHVIEYDGKSLLNYNHNKSLDTSHPQAQISSHEYSNSFQQISVPSLPVPVNTGQPSVDSGVTVGGYHDGTATRFPIHTQNVNSCVQFDDNACPLQNQLNASHQDQLHRDDSMVTHGLLQSATHGFQAASSSNPSRGIEELFPEEEIRIRSHEMLENEDMQHLLRIFNMGGQTHGSLNAHEDGFSYSSAYMAANPMSYNCDDERGCSSGKAVVGWLKLKAALRWGIFVRKKAAERRAQLVELDDS